MFHRRGSNKQFGDEKFTDTLELDMDFKDTSVTASKFKDSNVINKVGVGMIATARKATSQTIWTNDGGWYLRCVKTQHEEIPLRVRLAAFVATIIISRLPSVQFLSDDES